jgi:hypothetical protein
MRFAPMGLMLTLAAIAATVAAAADNTEVGGRLDQMVRQATVSDAVPQASDTVLCRFQQKDALPPPPGASEAIVSDATEAPDAPPAGVLGIPVGAPGEPIPSEKKAETPETPKTSSAIASPRPLPPPPGYKGDPESPKPAGKSPFTEEKPGTILSEDKPETPLQATSEAVPGEEPKANDEPKEWRLFHGSWLEKDRIDIRGWLDQGYTWNPFNPADKFNGPMGYNDRANEYQLNQLYLVTERVTKTDECHTVDLGGRVDVLFGTDHRFTRSTPGTGFDADWDTGRFYGFSMPQLYGDLQVDKLIIRAGHFLYPCGAENVTAPDNFFYSHSYTFLYGQPTTYTGGMLKYLVSDKFALLAGLDTGWNNFDDPNGKTGFFAGFNWTSKNEKTSLNYVISVSDEQPTGAEGTRTHYCLCLTRKLNDKWTLGLEHDLGVDSFSARAGTDAEWFSVIPYLTYQINSCWAVGMRYEWLRDDEGVIVIPPSDPFGGAAGDWNDISLGVKYTPNKNVMVRSEIRYDWLSAAVPGIQEPFDDNTKNFQWTWGTDLIVKF